MGIVSEIAVVIVVVGAVAGAIIVGRRRSPAPDDPAATDDLNDDVNDDRPAPLDDRDTAPPMTGLDDALRRVTDGSGATMAERLDAEDDHVDRLRGADDASPLLGRALDSIETSGDPEGGSDAEPSSDA